MKKNIILALCVVIALFAGLWIWNSYQEKNSAATPVSNDTILFYGKECPHCQDLDKFISDNKISDKISFDSLEVWHNKANGELMLKKAQECGYGKDQLGVPFLYDKGKCYMGGPEAEKFFKDAAGIQ